jgi:heme exporter protein D
MSVSDFFHMGGYAFYVWTAYGMTLVVLVLNVVLPLRRYHRLKRQAQMHKDAD